MFFMAQKSWLTVCGRQSGPTRQTELREGCEGASFAALGSITEKNGWGWIMEEKKKAALYLRLSKEDQDKLRKGDDSASIQNQRLLLTRLRAGPGDWGSIFRRR